MSSMEITDTFQSEEHDEISTHIDGSRIHFKNGTYGEISLSHMDFETIIDQYNAFKVKEAA